MRRPPTPHRRAVPHGDADRVGRARGAGGVGRPGAANGRRLARAALAVALATGAAGCRRDASAPLPAPVEATVGVPDTAPAPGPLPTWTLGAALGAEARPVAVAPGGAPAVDGTAGAAGAPPAVPGQGGDAAAAGLPAPTPRPTAAVAAAGPPATDPAIVSLMGAVSADRLRADVATLVGFGTRHVLSSPEGGRRGIGAARSWLGAAFTQASRGAASQLVVGDEPFPLTFGGRSTEQRNVVATLTGIGDAKRFVYVVAHYDARAAAAEDGAGDAPGASDNASGTAALLELARVLGRRQWDATIRLVATTAGEAGQLGARYHAAHARALGAPIVAVFDNDGIGGAAGPGGSPQPAAVRAVAAGGDDGASLRLARHAAVIAARYAEHLRAPAGPLAVEPVGEAAGPDREGDDAAFTEASFAALRLADAVEDGAARHGPADTADRLDPAYHAAVVRLNVALAANLALAPAAVPGPPRLVADASPPGRYQVLWDAVPDAAVAGYVVAWRRAGEARYAGTVWSATTAAVLDGLPTDGDLRVAVAASDDLGHLGPFGAEARR